jgi:uncharacterized membrane protein HdeD (DUF308 family)
MEQVENQKNETQKPHKRLHIILALVLLFIQAGILGYMIGSRIWSDSPINDGFLVGILIAINLVVAIFLLSEESYFRKNKK